MKFAIRIVNIASSPSSCAVCQTNMSAAAGDLGSEQHIDLVNPSTRGSFLFFFSQLDFETLRNSATQLNSPLLYSLLSLYI